MDLDNPVVKLCTQGMEAEASGNLLLAKQLFQDAWDEQSNDYEASIAAHYMARRCDDPMEKLHWNQVALEHALADGSNPGFYPSLYLTLGQAHEDLGDLDAAGTSYRQAAAWAGELPDDGYGRMLHEGIERALNRVAPVSAARG